MTEAEIFDVCERLSERILEGEKSKVLPKILRKMLNPDQLKLAAEFPAVEEDLPARVGRSAEEVRKDLQYMYEIGIGTPAAKSKKWNLPRSFMLLVDKVGSHHRPFLPFLGPEYVDLWEDLEEERLESLIAKNGTVATTGGGHRMIPAYLAVKDNPELQPWEDITAVLRMADKIALVPCTCRLRNRKRTCQMHTDEVCLLLNRDADYEVDSKAGRYISLDEAIKVALDCEKLGSLHIVPNTRAVANLLCNCCDDCCTIMRRLSKYPEDRDWFHASRYVAQFDEALCKGCGTCVSRCHFGAVSMEKSANGKKGKAVVDQALCMGCGNCAIMCPVKAISLKCDRPEEHVPKGIWTRGKEKREGADYERYLKL